jgi:hypothetical protein
MTVNYSYSYTVPEWLFIPIGIFVVIIFIIVVWQFIQMNRRWPK